MSALQVERTRLASSDRRAFLRACGAMAGSVAALSAGPLRGEPKAEHLTLGFSTYGMKTLKTEDALRLIERIGFDAVEITVWPDWDAAPGNMSRARRRAIRDYLRGTRLQLTSLMEHVAPAKKDGDHRAQLERLRGVFELAGDLADRTKPLVQTVLGGGQWLRDRNWIRDRIGDWVREAESAKATLAVKPHRGGVLSRPSEAVWLFEQLNKPANLGMVYDYSHYAFRDMTLENTVQTALPYLKHVAVKDAVQQGDRVVFQLPGQAGTIPYDRLLRQLFEGGYRGDISCEVSGMVWSRGDYQPEKAARQCYQALAKAFQRAKIPRP